MALTTPESSQPDFQLISTEIKKIANMPVVQQGNLIFEELRRINTIIENTLDRMDGRFDRIDGKLDRLDATIVATDANRWARAANSTIKDLNSELSPLATKDNQAVHSFPTNLGALKALSCDATTELLGAYNLSDQGTFAEKKRRFRSFIGVVADMGCDEDITGILAEMALEEH